MSVSGRLAIQKALRNIERHKVTFVGHSVGLTFNLAFGPCRPVRRRPRKWHRSGRYLLTAERDIFAFACNWRLPHPSGYSLASSDCGKRIARDLAELRGLTVISVRLKGSRHHLVVQFSDGKRLELRGNPNDIEDPYGWEITGLPGLGLHFLTYVDEVSQ
jgi:hypothetical protein